MSNSKLVQAYKSLMKAYEEYEQSSQNSLEVEESSNLDEEFLHTHNLIDDMGIEEYNELLEGFNEENRQADEIKEKIEKCKKNLRQQGIISHDEQLIAVINSVLSDDIDITSRNLDVILSVLPEESKIGKMYVKNPIDAGMGGIVEFDEVGQIYKNCGIDIETLDKSLLLDKKFMEGYIKAHSHGEKDLSVLYTDIGITNQDIINHVNSLCDEKDR